MVHAIIVHYTTRILIYGHQDTYTYTHRVPILIIRCMYSVHSILVMQMTMTIYARELLIVIRG